MGRPGNEPRLLPYEVTIQECGGECWMCGGESVESRVPPIQVSVSIPIPARGEVSGIGYWNTVV